MYYECIKKRYFYYILYVRSRKTLFFNVLQYTLIGILHNETDVIYVPVLV